MRRFAALIIAATSIVTIAGAPARCTAQAAAQGQDSEEYRIAVREALDAFAAKNWVRAQQRFRAAHALQPSARTLRGLGMVAFEMQDYVEARKLLRAALDDARKPLDEALRSETEALLERTHRLLGRVRVTAAPEQARVLLDGAPASTDEDGETWIATGTHVVTVEAAGYARETQAISVTSGGRVELSVELERVQPRAEESDAARSQELSSSLIAEPYGKERDGGGEAITAQWWFWAGAGALALGVGASVVLLTSGKEEQRAETRGTGGVVITTLSLP